MCFDTIISTNLVDSRDDSVLLAGLSSRQNNLLQGVETLLLDLHQSTVCLLQSGLRRREKGNVRTTSDTTTQSHLAPLLAGLLHLDLVKYSPRLSRQKLRSLRSQLQVGRGSAVLVDDQLLPQEALQDELPDDPVGFQSCEMSGLPVQRVLVPPTRDDLLTLAACQVSRDQM